MFGSIFLKYQSDDRKMPYGEQSAIIGAVKMVPLLGWILMEMNSDQEK